MKKYLFVSLLITLYSCVQPKDASGQLPVSSEFNEKQVKLISETLRAYPENTQFSIAIIRDGKVVFIGGKRQADTMALVVNHDRAFEIGSISKVFTSTLLAESVLKGKIALDDQIDKTLGSPLKDNIQISFKQLANHSSGLPRLPSNMNMFAVDPANPYKDYDEKKLREYVTNELKVAQAPGVKSEYSNLGVGLLGYLITLIEKKSYEDLLQEKISSKFKMNSTTTDRSKIDKILVKGLNPSGSEVPNWDLNVLVGAGGIVSTAEDLSKFALAQFDKANKAMALTRETTFKLDEAGGIGLGWHMRKRDDREYFNHNGGTGGYRSSMTIEPNLKNAVIVLSNVSAFHPESGKIDVLCRDLIVSLQN